LERLDSAIPDRDSLTREAAKLGKEMPGEDLGDEKLFLSRALQVEVETSDFYRQMVREMTDTARDMFARFLEIEEGHIAAVQAELDYLSKTGYWFGIKEFDME
jgi:bacterioferritin (cytochrome b1)